ncbi:MAG TPA: DUF979 domain-containing protein [Vitreimonas sp.]|uniref:DUF979 domain-containing protein n=1 Tax=Vitreimonas sp. TaxID=3069702 RepID=UPI002D2AECAE|nr:DUF979 domain-containing protein [Vitreimonas sp.]HYD88116.1 DUF979 domain-containing protein [Vitreimonas sp.]
MITLTHAYIVAGLFFAAMSLLSALDASNRRRIANFLFWGMLAASFLAGGYLGDLGNGLLALGLVAVATFGLGEGKPQTTTPEQRRESAMRRGDALFLPALIIPAVALGGTLIAKETSWGPLLIDPAQATLVSLILGALIAVAVAMLWLRPPLIAPFQEARRLIDAVGWAAILPQMLASLGAVFLVAGVGEQVGRVFGEFMPLDNITIAVIAYCVGMALFTIIMGNAFAAFPVMTAAVGLPIVVMRFGGDPAIVCAIGMLAGFCGTLMTPMAANFNVVPANLLELPDRKSPLNGVIRAQIPTALPLLLANILLMRILAFPQ